MVLTRGVQRGEIREFSRDGDIHMRCNYEVALYLDTPIRVTILRSQCHDCRLQCHLFRQESKDSTKISVELNDRPTWGYTTAVLGPGL